MMAADDIVPSSDSFWEVDCYKRTVKRQDDGYKLCSELMNLINERGHIEKEYAKQLKGWGKKWTDFIEKGPEYGTAELACKAVMQEAETVAELHLEVRERLVTDVHNTIKTWRTENYHKSMVGQCKETKELEDGFKKAQKPWAKHYQSAMATRKQYHRACKALMTVEEQAEHSDLGSTHSLSFAQKPWAKRYSKVMKARKDYHSAVKQEKTATNQENNSKNDSAVSPDQVKKMQERVEKCRRDVESSKVKYEEALSDINSYNAKYMEDMTEVFSKCQSQEEKRMKFFKEMLFGIHKCLDLSVNPAYGAIYVKLKQQIGMADAARDLKFWSEKHGVDMPMNWPTFEEYAPEPHTISRKEKRGNSDAITLTALKQNDTPTHTGAPVAQGQQSYQNFQQVEETHTPPASASSQVSHNRKSGAYDPGLNPFGEDDAEEFGKDNPSSKRSSNNGSALDEWTDDVGAGMEEVMRVPVRALYDYHGQEEDELSFKSGEIFTKLKNEDDQGWCVGEKDGTVGLYPRDYVEVI